MEDSYRNNVIEFSFIYLNKDVNESINELEFSKDEFCAYIFKQLFNIEIDTGYGLDNSTKEMTNDIGDLKIYNKNDANKEEYLKEIKPGDLVFFHTKSLDCTNPNIDNFFPGHTGIYLGNKEFIHVDENTSKIEALKIDDNWLKLLVGSRDIIKSLNKTM